jgi:hypothetical protein
MNERVTAEASERSPPRRPEPAAGDGAQGPPEERGPAGSAHGTGGADLEEKGYG